MLKNYWRIKQDKTFYTFNRSYIAVQYFNSTTFQLLHNRLGISMW